MHFCRPVSLVSITAPPPHMIALSMTSLVSKIDYLDFTAQEKKKEEIISLHDSGCDLEQSPHSSPHYNELQVIPEKKPASPLHFGSEIDLESMSSVDSCEQSEADNNYITIDKAFCIHKAEFDTAPPKYCDSTDCVAGTDTSRWNAQEMCTCMAASDTVNKLILERDPESGIWLPMDSQSSSGVCRT